MKGKLQREIDLPIATVSESNTHEHWTKSRKRHREQQFIMRSAMKGVDITLPCIIEFTRCSSRTLDSDNLPVSCKWLRDEIADILIPGLKKGRADDDPRLEWTYEQLKSRKKRTIVRFYEMHKTIPT